MFSSHPFAEEIFLGCKKDIGAGINTWMSIFDGLGPSIYCRKMKNARPMREEMDGKVVFVSSQSGLSDFDVVIHRLLSLCVS